MVYSIIFTENVKPEWVCPTFEFSGWTKAVDGRPPCFFQSAEVTG